MPRRLLVSLALLSMVVLAGCSSDSSSKSATAATIEVHLSDKGCEPRAISTPAGKTAFHVRNDGTARVSEFEVLAGTRILGEVENVIPGSDRTFSVDLAAGSYTTKCPGGTEFEAGTLAVAAAG